MQVHTTVRISQTLFWVLFTGLLVGLYAPMLFGQISAFRDAFHFYYPFETWLVEQAHLGESLPQYNPFDGTGINAVGESSSYFFYPLRILWWTPGLSVPQRLGLFLLVHNCIAAWGTAYAAKRIGLGEAARALAVCAYALSGPVLFQHTNPVYLIGAAWLPWALGELVLLAIGPSPLSITDSCHSPHNNSPDLSGISNSPRFPVVVGATALMVLGGDPQAAVHAGVIALLACFFRAIHNRNWLDLWASCLWLSKVAVLVLGVTCVQWLPTLLWLQHSSRVLPLHLGMGAPAESARGIPQLFETLSSESSQIEALVGPLRSTYAYSIAPWHLLSLIWATAGGHAFPEHSRWLQSLAAEPNMWCPSLSLGLIPALLATLGYSWRSASRLQRVLFWLSMFAGAAMLGDYTLVWLLRQMLHACGARDWANHLPSDQVSGIYWLLTQCVPFYAAFRYPAKWSVWFVGAMSLAAAAALERAIPFTRLTRTVCGLILATVCLLLMAASLSAGGQLALTQWLAQAPGDPWLGSPTSEAVRTQWIWATSTTLVVLLALLVTLFRRNSIGTEQLRWMWVSMTMLELGLASTCWIVVHDAPSAASLQALWGDASLPPAVGPIQRVWTGVGRANFNSQFMNSDFINRVGPHHYQKVCAFQELFYLGKLHLLENNRGNMAAFTSLTPRSLAAVRQRLARADTLAPHNPELDQALAWLGISHRLTFEDGFHWREIANCAPFIDWQPATPTNLIAVSEPPPTPPTKLIDFDCDDFTLHVKTLEPGKLVVRLLQDGGWRVRLVPAGNETNPTPSGTRPKAVTDLVPASTHLGLFQSLDLPAGEWIAYWQYECPGLRLGAIITLATAGTCLLGFARLTGFFGKNGAAGIQGGMIQSRDSA